MHRAKGVACTEILRESGVKATRRKKERSWGWTTESPGRLGCRSEAAERSRPITYGLAGHRQHSELYSQKGSTPLRGSTQLKDPHIPFLKDHHPGCSRENRKWLCVTQESCSVDLSEQRTRPYCCVLPFLSPLLPMGTRQQWWAQELGEASRAWPKLLADAARGALALVLCAGFFPRLWGV